MTVGTDGKTHYGTDPVVFGPELAAMGVDVIGVNCSVGPHGVLEAVEKLARVVSLPISAQPNAGLPREVGDRKIYMASPEYMASYARRMVEAGARFVGGCCGTTPDHIRAIVGFVQSVSPRHAFDMGTLPAPAPAVAIEPVPLAARSRLGAKLAEGRFVTTVEIVPPKGVDPAPMFEQVRQLKAAGVDAVNVPDGPRAQSRMGALLSALMIEREVGLEAVVHYACRDRNLLGMLSDLLGAAAAGIRNLLIITGDPPKMGPYPEATAVFDIDSIGLTNLVSRLNHGLDPGGNPIGAADQVRDRRGGESRRARLRARAQAVRLQGGGRRRVRDHPAGVRSGPARPVPRAGRELPHPDRRGDLAAGLAPQRGVPGQRGARRVGAGRGRWTGCARRAPAGRRKRWRKGCGSRARCSRPWRTGCRAFRSPRRWAECRWRSTCSRPRRLNRSASRGYTPPT